MHHDLLQGLLHVPLHVHLHVPPMFPHPGSQKMAQLHFFENLVRVCFVGDLPLGYYAKSGFHAYEVS